jgi:hypothetical protein
MQANKLRWEDSTNTNSLENVTVPTRQQAIQAKYDQVSKRITR